MLIEQAIYGGHDVGGYRFLAQSPGFVEAWLAEAQRLCTGFGERPAGATCPGAVFSLPFRSRLVAVVQVADQGQDDAGRPGALAFRLLILPHKLYAGLGGDPFLIADAFPPAWNARGELPTLEWTAGAPPQRTVEQLRRVLDVEPARTALLLGGAQILVDGGRLVFERNRPDGQLLRDLWMLLPTATRTGLWPASFAFGNANEFHVLVVPHARGSDYEGYVPEAQAGDYPEGRYELALQTAVESSNQADVDVLLTRRSRSQVLRLGVLLLLVFAVGALLLRMPIDDREEKPAGKPKNEKAKQLEQPLKLPPEDALRPWTPEQRQQLADRLQELSRRLHLTLPAGRSEEALADAVVDLDRQVDRKLPDRPRRDPGDLATQGSAQRRLRALLWKHGAPEYAEPRLNPLELMDRLEEKLKQQGLLKEDGGE